ncbi:MAG: class I SAM-dependent methyltransferase [Phycisphaeraceae bacterium]|nr:class I SAM-dependent methyltransferase [Phycisphaeraceae bacterium]
MNHLLREAAASVGASPALVPFLGLLFEGVDSLGSSPARVVRMLRNARVGPGSRVLDLGCGKGAAAIALAQTLGCRCTGIDAVPEFVAAANAAARQRGVSKLCEFRAGNLRQFARAGAYDAAIMLGVLDVERGRRVLRRSVRPGGVYILDDAVAVRPRRGCPTLDEARRILTRGGDRIEVEDLWTPQQTLRQEEQLHRQLSRNAARIAMSHPRLQRSLASFLQRQQRAARELQTRFQPVQWMVRKSGWRGGGEGGGRWGVLSLTRSNAPGHPRAPRE